MIKMIMQIWARTTGGELVWLKDHDGEVNISIARIDPWGDKVAKRYWPFETRMVRLRENGKVDGGYVEYWMPADTRVQLTRSGRVERKVRAEFLRGKK